MLLTTTETRVSQGPKGLDRDKLRLNACEIFMCLTIKNATFKQLSRLFQCNKLFFGEESVVHALALFRPRRTGRDRHSAQVKVVSDCVLKLVVHAPFGKPGV